MNQQRNLTQLRNIFIYIDMKISMMVPPRTGKLAAKARSTAEALKATGMKHQEALSPIAFS